MNGTDAFSIVLRMLAGALAAVLAVYAPVAAAIAGISAGIIYVLGELNKWMEGKDSVFKTISTWLETLFGWLGKGITQGPSALMGAITEGQLPNFLVPSMSGAMGAGPNNTTVNQTNQTTIHANGADAKEVAGLLDSHSNKSNRQLYQMWASPQTQ